MKALSRLAAIAASAGGVLASAGAAWAGLGQPTPWQMDLQDSASPVMQDVADFHTFLLWVIAVICAVVLGLLLTCIVRFNARQSDAVAYHSQHADRNYLDHRSGHHPGVNRSAVVPAVVRPDSSAYTRPDREGYRQTMVLELQLSGQRQFRIRFADGSG
jgi:hypothetical protein